MLCNYLGSLLIEILVLFVIVNKAEKQTATKVGKQKRETKGETGNAIHSEHGFKMFSMMDFPQKSLKEYSLDHVQRLIYSDDDLGHTNGILTDKEVIEQSAIPVLSQNKRITTKKNKVSSNETPTERDSLKDSEFLLGVKQSFLKQKRNGQHNKFSSHNGMENISPIKSLGNNRSQKPQSAREFDDKRYFIPKRPKISRKITIHRLSPKPSDKRNYAINNNEADKSRSFPKITERASILFGKPKTNSLGDIQKYVSIGKIQRPSRRIQKSSRSADERGKKIDEMIEKQLKLLKNAPNAKIKSASKPNEREFFFFKNAFEYGAKLLARKLAKDGPVHNILKGSIFTEASNNRIMNENDDLDKKNTLTLHNITKKDQKEAERRVGQDNLGNRKNLQKYTEMFVKAPTTAITKATNKHTYNSNIASSNLVNLNHGVNSQKALSTGKATKNRRLIKHKTFTSTVKLITKQGRLKSDYTSTRSPSTTTAIQVKSSMEKVIVDERNATAFLQKKNLVQKDESTMLRSRPVNKKNVFDIPKWKLPPFYYRRPCPNKADVMFGSQDNKIYAIDENMVYIIGSYGVEIGPMPLQFVWPEVDSPLNDGYVRLTDRMLFLFFKNKYAAFIKDRELVGEPSEISAIGLPNGLTPIDAVSSWTGNEKTYFFKNEYYWRYNDWENRLDKGYPKQIKQHWRNVPENVDTAFIAPNSHLYFVKEGFIYKMYRYRASVQYRYPKKLSESCYDFFM